MDHCAGIDVSLELSSVCRGCEGQDSQGGEGGERNVNPRYVFQDARDLPWTHRPDVRGSIAMAPCRLDESRF